MTPRFHFTCADHGSIELGVAGVLVTARARDTHNRIPPTFWPADFVWLTDLRTPNRDALGLTQHLVTCDRTAVRYRVVDVTNVVPWITVRRTVPAPEVLEAEPGAHPRHWYVSRLPVPVVLDPR